MLLNNDEVWLLVRPEALLNVHDICMPQLLDNLHLDDCTTHAFVSLSDV